MNTSSIIAAIDKEIAQLLQARAIIAGSENLSPLEKRGRGRPKGSTNGLKVVPVPVKRGISPEGRARIAEAQRKRHAAAKRAAKKAAAEEAAAA